MTTTDIHRTIEAVWRIESAKLIAALARMVHDIGLAEELAPDALVAALERWPETGVPGNPAAWLLTTAKRRGTDPPHNGRTAVWETVVYGEETPEVAADTQ